MGYSLRNQIVASDNQPKIQHPSFPGYYQIQKSNCYINVFGRVWSEEKCSFLTPYLVEYSEPLLHGRYPTINIGTAKPYAIHILIAELFVDRPIDRDAIIVNHIDGDKENYFAGNLEWVTYSENLIHAFKTGLRTDNIPVLLKDLETGKVVKFYSMNECARHLYINTSTLHLYMKKQQTLPFMKKWDVIRDGKSWNPIPNSAIGLERLGKDRLIIGIKKPENDIFLFSSVMKAVEHTGVSKHIIWHRLMRSVKPKIRHAGVKPVVIDWEFFYHKDYNGTLENVKEILGESAGKGLIRSVKKPIPITVENLKTGEINEYPSTQMFCDEKEVQKGTVQQSVYLKGRWKHYKIDYQRPTKNVVKASPSEMVE